MSPKSGGNPALWPPNPPHPSHQPFQSRPDFAKYSNQEKSYFPPSMTFASNDQAWSHKERRSRQSEVKGTLWSLLYNACNDTPTTQDPDKGKLDLQGGDKTNLGGKLRSLGVRKLKWRTQPAVCDPIYARHHYLAGMESGTQVVESGAAHLHHSSLSLGQTAPD